jgi:hypothetical protein
MHQLCLDHVANLIILLDFATQSIGEGMWGTRGEIVDFTINTIRLVFCLFDGEEYPVGTYSLLVSAKNACT